MEFDPEATYFKPQGIPMRQLESVNLTCEEMEAFRLRHLEDLDQREAAVRMETSASTYQRILGSAARKIAEALVGGKAIRIVKPEQVS